MLLIEASDSVEFCSD